MNWRGYRDRFKALPSDVETLADAVNQLALVVEHIAYRTAHDTMVSTDYQWALSRCHKLREEIERMIPK